MPATHSSGGFFKSRALTWVATTALFAAATALQIAIYAIVVPTGALSSVAGSIVLVLAAVWLVLPAGLATFLAVRTFRLIEPVPAQRSTQSLLASFLFPLASVYLGVFVSFNTWGGK